ncbi:glycosyltransferase family 2 protein [Cytophagaceae bacterium ABcell3]|nr:glycosyltransferase family 2 protein [Cytophagaceae bacterium ABcell3]
MEEIAIVILNWNGKKYLELFLPSVINNSAGAKIYIADNNSADDSVPFLERNYPEVTIIQFSENKGFCKGYNDALNLIDSKYYLLLNSDVEVTEGWLEPLLQVFRDDEKVAACQPKIKDYKKRDYFEYAGAAGGFIDKWGYPFCRGRIFFSLEKDTGQYNDIAEVFWGSGACLLIKSEAFHEVGGLDESFFAHMEEIDICWRLKNLGYKIMYCGKSEVFHVGGGTLSKSSPTKTFLNFRNSIYNIYKNNPGQISTKIAVRLILDGVAGARFLFTDSWRHTMAILRAHFSFYLNINQLKQKRALEKKRRKINTRSELYHRSIVFDYFKKGKQKFSDLKLKVADNTSAPSQMAVNIHNKSHAEINKNR